MTDDQREPTQKTQPQGTDDEGEPAKPIEIPVPKRGDIERLLKRSAQPPAKQRQAPPKPPPQRHQRRGR